jgi:hypothetical protein
MNSHASTKILLFISFVFTGFFNGTAQNLNSDKQSHSNYAAISTSFPFLRSIPDARSTSMGEAGVARAPDVNALIINPSAIVLLPHQAGFGVSHNPWLKSIMKDMSLSYFSAYLNSGKHAIGLSLRYFSVGETTFRNEEAVMLGIVHPMEYALDFTYAKRLGPDFALGGTIRYVQSRLAMNEQATAMRSAASALAADVSAYLRKPGRLFGYEAVLAAGINISNIGPASSDPAGEANYLPTNLRMGTSATLEVDGFSHLTIAADLNKLLVPTSQNLAGSGNEHTGFPTSMWQSFSDGPLGEELSEISLSLGLEYTFKQQFSIRGGYLYAHPEKGNYSYPTLGAGVQHRSMRLDVAYLPVNVEKSPMANTLKISLMFNFGELAQSRHGFIKPF